MVMMGVPEVGPGILLLLLRELLGALENQVLDQCLVGLHTGRLLSLLRAHWTPGMGEQGTPSVSPSSSNSWS